MSKNCIYQTLIKKLAQVGIAEYFSIDSTLVRLAWVIYPVLLLGLVV